MRTLIISLTVLCSLALPACTSGQATPARQHCSVQPAHAATDADKSFAGGDASKAEALWNAQLTPTPSPAIYAGIIRAQLQQDKLSQALASAKADVAAFPTDAEPYASIGDVLLRLGQIPEASAAYAKALALNQCSPRAHFGWSRVNALQSRHETEARQLAAAHALAPADPEITVAWLDARPAPERAEPLAAFLATNPILPPETITRLQTDLAALQLHAFCLPIEANFNGKLALQPIVWSGSYVRSWGLQTSVNGKNLALVELDSAVHGIILNPADAQKAVLHRIGPAPALSTTPYTAIADSLKIGSIEYRNCPVRVASASALANANSVVGVDFFRDKLIHLDYVEQALTLSPLPSPAAGTTIPDGFVPDLEKDWTHVYVAGSTLLIETLVDKKGPFLFVMGTGMPWSIISPTVNDATLKSAKVLDTGLSGTSAQIVKVLPYSYNHAGVPSGNDLHGPTGEFIDIARPVKLPLFRFAKWEFPDRGVYSFSLTPLSHATGVEVGGIFSFDLLSQFSFDLDYRDGLVNFAFDQNRRYATRQRDLGGNPY
jgi:tetratricopeptide (TPR) repeat protein